MQQSSTIPQYTEPDTHFEPPTTPPPKKGEGLKSVLSTVLILVAAPLIAIALTAFVFQSYEVDGPSMESTLQNRDRLIVIKAGKTFSRIFNTDYYPDRGEVIVFVKRGLYEGTDRNEKQLIKRVIGLPGDRIVVKDGSVTVFNNAHPSGYNPDTTGEYQTAGAFTPGEIDYTVADKEIFVMGDNRTNSLDSRNFGPISTADVVGHLVIRILPLNSIKTFK